MRAGVFLTSRIAAFTLCCCPAAEDRAAPGHLGGDLLVGAKNSYVATLVERHSRFVMLIKVPGKETEAVVAAVKRGGAVGENKRLIVSMYLLE